MERTQSASIARGCSWYFGPRITSGTCHCSCVVKDCQFLCCNGGTIGIVTRAPIFIFNSTRRGHQAFRVRRTTAVHRTALFQGHQCFLTRIILGWPKTPDGKRCAGLHVVMVHRFTVGIGGDTKMTPTGIQFWQCVGGIIFPFSVQKFVVHGFTHLGRMFAFFLVQARQTFMKMVLLGVATTFIDQRDVSVVDRSGQSDFARRSHHLFREMSVNSTFEVGVFDIGISTSQSFQNICLCFAKPGFERTINVFTYFESCAVVAGSSDCCQSNVPKERCWTGQSFAGRRRVSWSFSSFGVHLAGGAFVRATGTARWVRFVLGGTTLGGDKGGEGENKDGFHLLTGSQE